MNRLVLAVIALIGALVAVWYSGIRVQILPMEAKALQTSATVSSLENTPPQKPKEYTVVVVGGGLAGMAAAVEAERRGAHVYLLEKEKKLGGNSAKASSGINAVGTPAQRNQDVSDSIELFIKDTLESGGGLSDPALVDVLVRQSANAIDFLSEFGLDLSALSQLGGHSTKRTHRAKVTGDRVTNVGFEITNALRLYLESLPPSRVEIVTGARLTHLVVEHGRVVGVTYEDVDTARAVRLSADAVILASGGYARDGGRGGLLETYGSPLLATLPTTNGPWSTGDGIKIAAADAGAGLTLMDKVQIHPTAFVDPADPRNPTKFLAAEALRGSGGLLLSPKGERFVNELDLRSRVSDAIFKHCYHEKYGFAVAYLVLNRKAVELFQEAALAFYKSRGLVWTVANADALARNLSVSADVIKRAFAEYNEAAQRGGPDAFGKTTFPVAPFAEDEPLFVMMITPAIHYTMGGLRISPNAEVLRDDGRPIPGLYAAGEVTGGVHGENRLGGNSLLECVVFGRIAGRTAATPSTPRWKAAFDELVGALGPAKFVTATPVRLAHAKDGSHFRWVVPDAVAFPETTADVVTVMKVASRHRIPVVPRGAGSSLEGHTLAFHGGIVLSTANMTRVLAIHHGDMDVVVQPGIRRKALNAWLEQEAAARGNSSAAFFFPVDPGADASIGGMVSTRASGTAAVGYGTMAANVVSLEVVTPRGEVLRTAARTKKASSGYDLTHLYLGAEGTLGVITEVTLKLWPKPAVEVAVVLPLETVEEAARVVMQIITHGAHVQRCELVNAAALRAVNAMFNTTYAMTPHLFMEFHGMDHDEVRRRVDIAKGYAAAVIGAERLATAWSEAYDPAEREKLWHARHNAYYAVAKSRKNAKVFSTDVCVPISRLAECIAATEADFAGSPLVSPIVGHVGDGNFHLILPLDLTNPVMDELAEAERLNKRLVERALAMEGTCSGEHGVGVGKKQWLASEHGLPALNVMETIKRALDPDNIMNPGKLLGPDPPRLH